MNNKRMQIKVCLIMAGTLFSAGCMGTTTWVKPGSSAQQLRQAEAHCRLVRDQIAPIQQPNPSGYTYSGSSLLSGTAQTFGNTSFLSGSSTTVGTVQPQYDFASNMAALGSLARNISAFDDCMVANGWTEVAIQQSSVSSSTRSILKPASAPSVGADRTTTGESAQPSIVTQDLPKRCDWQNWVCQTTIDAAQALDEQGIFEGKIDGDNELELAENLMLCGTLWDRFLKKGPVGSEAEKEAIAQASINLATTSFVLAEKQMQGAAKQHLQHLVAVSSGAMDQWIDAEDERELSNRVNQCNSYSPYLHRFGLQAMRLDAQGQLAPYVQRLQTAINSKNEPTYNYRTINADGVWLLDKPDGSPVRQKPLEEGFLIDLHEVDGDWARVTFGTKIGWVPLSAINSAK